MNILQVSTFDISGGAESIALSIHNYADEYAYRSQMIVGWKNGNDPFITQLSPKSAMKKLYYRLLRKFEVETGIQAFGYRKANYWIKRHGKEIDFVHIHNMHGGYIDFNFLMHIKNDIPIIITLHDCWLLTGHCAHPLDCIKWKNKCNKCPHLDTYPPIKRDMTAFNFWRKQRILQKVKPVLVSPSKWLAKMIKESPLTTNMQCIVIPNGIDTSKFCDKDQIGARKALGLPEDKFIIAYAANGGLNSNWHKIQDYYFLRYVF
jgi:glycosyltransferase involved in cell wall biosynthesis